MAKKVKITKGGQTVYPATVMDAVVHPDLRVDSSKLIEEVNVSKIYPTGGIDGTNKYTLETAIAKIPSSLRNVGLKCSFLDEEGKRETWEYQSGEFDNINNWLQVGSASRGNMVLEWDTDVATTRKKVKTKQRKTGLIISYNDPENGIINEQYVYTSFSDSAWANDLYWKKILDKNDYQELEIQIENNTGVMFTDGNNDANKFIKELYLTENIGEAKVGRCNLYGSNTLIFVLQDFNGDTICTGTSTYFYDDIVMPLSDTNGNNIGYAILDFKFSDSLNINFNAKINSNVYNLSLSPRIRQYIANQLVKLPLQRIQYNIVSLRDNNSVFNKDIPILDKADNFRFKIRDISEGSYINILLYNESNSIIDRHNNISSNNIGEEYIFNLSKYENPAMIKIGFYIQYFVNISLSSLKMSKLYNII